MQEIFIHVCGVVLGAIVLRLLGLHKKVVVHTNHVQVSIIWKVLKSLGKFCFFYGLFVFHINLLVTGVESPNVGIGVTILTLGFFAWVIGSITFFIKGN